MNRTSHYFSRLVVSPRSNKHSRCTRSTSLKTLLRREHVPSSTIYFRATDEARRLATLSGAANRPFQIEQVTLFIRRQPAALLNLAKLSDSIHDPWDKWGMITTRAPQRDFEGM